MPPHYSPPVNMYIHGTYRSVTITSIIAQSSDTTSCLPLTTTVKVLAPLLTMLPLQKLGSVQQFCKQGDKQSHIFPHHTQGGSYPASY